MPESGKGGRDGGTTAQAAADRTEETAHIAKEEAPSVGPPRVSLLFTNMLPAINTRWDVRRLFSRADFSDTLQHALPPNFRFVRSAPLYSEGSVLLVAERLWDGAPQPADDAQPTTDLSAREAAVARRASFAALADTGNKTGRARVAGGSRYGSAPSSAPAGGADSSGGSAGAGVFGPRLPQSAEEVAAYTEYQLRKKRSRWWPVEALLGNVNAHPVHGIPFMHDMPPLFLSSMVRIEAHDADSGALVTDTTRFPDAEDLYPVLRMYGRVWRLERTAKDAITGASAVACNFQHVRYAVAARHCLDNARITVGGGASKLPAQDIRLRIRYMRNPSTGLRGLYNDHPRIMVPVTAAIIGFGAYFLFDPLRVWSIKRTVTDGWSLRALNPANMLSIAYGTLRDRVLPAQQKKLPDGSVSPTAAGGGGGGGSAHDDDEADSWSTWSDKLRESRLGSYLARIPGLSRSDSSIGIDAVDYMPDELERVRQWLRRPVSSPLVVVGPHGTGKFAIMRKAFTDVTEEQRATNRARPFPYVHVDMERLLEEGLDGDEFVDMLASATGFFPNFALSGAIGGAANALSKAFGGGDMGLASGGNSTTSRVLRILASMTYALEDVADEEARRDGPARMPLIVFTGFTQENHLRQHESLRVLMDWASHMCERRLCRVAFAMSDIGLTEYLRAELPEADMNIIALQDASPGSAVAFVRAHLKEDVDLSHATAQGGSTPGAAEAARVARVTDEELAEAVSLIGGRFSDLKALASRIEEGLSPIDAADALVRTATNEVRELLLNPTGQFRGSTEASRKSAQWTRGGLWDLMSLIVESKDGRVPYDKALFRCFNGTDESLRALARTNAFRIDRSGRGGGAAGAARLMVMPGTPVMLAAFRELRNDPRLRAGMDTSVAKEYKDYYFVRRAPPHMASVAALWLLLPPLLLLRARLTRNALALVHLTQAKAVKVEEELQRITKGSFYTRKGIDEAFTDRREYLLGKLKRHHASLQKWDAEYSAARKRSEA